MPAESLTRSRMDSFSDGVIAVIITIMVLELKVPSTHEMTTAQALRTDLKMGAVYLLSFVQTGIYWVNHHYLLDDLEQVSHGILWANLALLFCLSLIPFGTEWIAVRGLEPVPTAVYVVCFFLPAIAWAVLARIISRCTGVRPAAGPLKQALSTIGSGAAIGVAFLSPIAALAIIAAIAIWWLFPPPRVAEKMHARDAAHHGHSR